MKRRTSASTDLASAPDRSSDESSAALAAAQSALRTCEDALAVATQAYSAALDRGRDAALDARQQLTEAEVDRDVARRAVERLEGELAAARDREAARGRLAAYEDAQKKSEAAAAALARYPALAEAIADIITEVAAAEKAVAGTNADLPVGHKPLAPIERYVREKLGEDEQVLSSQKVMLWVEQGDAAPTKISNEHILITSPGRGVIEVPGMPRRDWVQVELREFAEEVFIPHLGSGLTKKLAETVVLPGFHSFSADHWKPVEPLNGIVWPQNILSRARELKTTAREIADRDPKTRYVPTDRTRVKFIGTTVHRSTASSPPA